MAVRLVGSAGTWMLPEGETLLGRGEDCGVRLVDPRLSRHHARLLVRGQLAQVQDLGSANGVLVNGDRIQAAKQLQQGDELLCGPLLLVVHCDGESAPDAVQARPGTEALISIARRKPGPSRSNTEQMDGREVAQALGLKVNPMIAAALEEANEAKDVYDTKDSVSTSRHTGSTSLRPSEMMAAPSSSSALSPNRFHQPSEPAAVRRTTSILPSEAPDQDTAALEAGHPGSASRVTRRARLLAGIGDPLVMLLLATGLGVALALGGSVVALQLADAGVADGMVVLPGAPPAGIGDLALALLQPATWLKIDVLAHHLHTLASPWPFLLLFLALALGAVLAELTLLWGLVAATVQHGAPRLHRRCGLSIVVRRNGHHLGWLRAGWRWLLLMLTAPIALITAWCGVRGLHDLLSGCEVRAK